MSDPSQSRPTPLGIYERPVRDRLTTAELFAYGLSVVWLIGSAVFFMFMRNPNAPDATDLDSLRFVMTALAIFMPVAMIWVAATAARAGRAT